MLVQLKALVHEAFFFLATCNTNLGEKDIACSCRILDICKLLWDQQCDYLQTRSDTEGDFSCNLKRETPLRFQVARKHCVV